MKIRFIALLFIPLISFATPDWLFKIESSNSSEIIGYGVNSSLKEAKQSAISEIAQSLHVSVDSSADISTSDENGEVNKSTSLNLKTSSKAVLSGVEFFKVEKIDDTWYVAAKYDNSPLEIKLKKLLPSDLMDEDQNAYLKESPLCKNVTAEVGKKLNYKIVRKNNLWQLNYKDILLPLNQNDFYKLFFTKENQNISIKANQQIYQTNDEIYFNIDHKEDGYITIAYVEHNGKVGVLLPNYRSKKSFIYPDVNGEDRFKIANQYSKPIEELYIAIYSKDKIAINDLESVSENLLDESNFNFDKLLLKLNDFDFSTYMIKIKK